MIPEQRSSRLLMTGHSEKEGSIMKKRLLAVITAAVLMTVLGACGNRQESVPASSASAASDSEEGSAAPGTADGWVLNDDSTGGFVPDEAQAAFDKAAEAFAGQEFDIIAYLGSQVVAGTNHMFLCRGTMVTQEPVVGLKVVIVYEDLEGNAEISKVTDLDLGEYVMVDNEGPEARQTAGGWTVYPDAPAADLPADAGALFDAVMDELTGAEYAPLAFLGSHDTGGTSKAFLARQTLVTREPVANMCLVYIYAPESGAPELMSIYVLDLADFNA